MKKLILSLCLVLAGCAGPLIIKHNFEDYNQVLHYNDSQQLLLNIVRVRYHEFPYFLKTGNLSTSYNHSYRGSIGETAMGMGFRTWEIGPSFQESPTVTYTPLDGEVFVKQLLSEMDPKTFVLLSRSGWPVSVLSKLMVDRVETTQPNTPAVQRWRDEIKRAEDQNNVHVITGRDGASQLLVNGTPVPLRNLVMRSFADILYKLSHDVEVPEAHQSWARNNKGEGLMKIQSSKAAPSDALVSVSYQGYYFSISHNDIQSKDTFLLVQMLYQLASGDIKTTQPVLTLPVGGSASR